MIPPHAIICVAAFTLAFGCMLGYHATPFYAFDHLGGGAAMSGNFGAVQFLVYTAVSLISARLVGGVKNGLTIAVFGVALFIFSYGAVPYLTNPALCILSSAIGLGGMALTWPAIHSWIGGEPDPVQRARHMSWVNMSWSSAASIGPLFAGPMYDYDYRLPFAGLVVACVIVVLLLRCVPNEHSHFEAPTQEFLDARAAHDQAGEAFLWPAWISVAVFNALGSAIRMIYPKRVEELVDAGALRWLAETEVTTFLSHNPATIFALLSFAYNFGTAVAFMTMGRTHGWKHRFSILVVPQAIACAALLTLALTHSLLAMAIASVAVGAGHGICFFNGSYYSLSNPALKHRRAAINEGMVGGGALLGTFSFGQLASALGTTLPFLYAPAGVLLLLAAQFHLLRRARRAE